MNNSIFHQISRVLWGVIVTLVVLLAVYVSLGRMLTAATGSYQQQILQELNQRAPFTIDARAVSAEWRSFHPVLILDGLRLTLPGASGRPVELKEGRIGIDVASSLRTWSLQMTRLQLDGLQLSGELTEKGQLRIRGFEAGESSLRAWAENYLMNLEDLVLSGIQLALTLPTGESRELELELQLTRERSRRRLGAELRSNRGLRVVALGEGVGNPFEPELFDGEFHLDVDVPEVGALEGFLVQALPDILLEGRLGMQLWSSWNRGVPTAKVQFEGEGLRVTAADQSWQLPLERLAFDASLVQRESLWDLFIADLEVMASQTTLKIPRLQLNAWGETLRLRATELPLEPLALIVAGLQPAPPAAKKLVRDLRPRGTLTALQVNIADVTSLAAGWDAQARFQQLAVDPWHGAPGVTGASGLVEVVPGSGRVLLDSQQFTMSFPTVYRRPLEYDDFHGTIDIKWDTEVLTLVSGLVEASAAEGRVPVVFGLTFPLQESSVGPEMDLLVGLENTTAEHRHKYIPFLLGEQLRGWLADSIQAGLIEQGGFLWRGSLKSAAPQLRTVQLFFNIEDAALNYHPGWPAVTGVDGVVLISDGEVSVWADNASLFDSTIDLLSVEVWRDDAAQLRLAIDASLEGPAADGLTVVNESNLNRLAGSVFARWQLAGDLQTDLKLAMNLGDTTEPPQVDLVTRFTGVDLDIDPGQLFVGKISGALNYRTGQGFSSTDLVGELWGRSLYAAVGQSGKLAGRRGARPAVTIDLASVIDVGDLSDWLGLDLLEFARGRSAVAARLVVPAKAPGRLTLDTRLEGISLALPSPWGKSAGTARQLDLKLSPHRGGAVLGVELEGGLQAQLDFTDNSLQAGALAFGQEPAGLEAGVLRVTGRAGRVNVAEWSRFLSGSFGPGLTGGKTGKPGAAGGAPARISPLEIRADQLQVAQLEVGGQDLGELEFDLSGSGRQWQVAARGGWVQGELLYRSDDQPSQLVLHSLDLAGLPELPPATGAAQPGAAQPGAAQPDAAQPDAVQPIVKLPPLDVTIDGLRQGERSLGSLAFTLRSEDEVLLAENITGSIAGLELAATTPGRLRWHQGEGSRTEMQARLNFQDLGQTLNQLGYEEILATEQGAFELALEWPGAPQGFSLQDGRGSLSVAIGEGRFLDAPAGASGALRVVSILNLAEIVQRLSLAHMFESGIPFDQIDGEVLLQDGTIEVAKMDVQGGSSSFQFSGTSKVASRTLDGELVVTLPVANNLPWVAALTAGLPVAAGVFLLSKVFEKQFNRLTSAVYGTSGTWDDPSVKFKRIFDVTAPPAEAAKPSAQPSAP